MDWFALAQGFIIGMFALNEKTETLALCLTIVYAAGLIAK